MDYDRYIWRLEGPDGKGPYNTKVRVSELKKSMRKNSLAYALGDYAFSEHMYDERTPAPPLDYVKGDHHKTLADIIPPSAPSVLFGYSHLAQAKAWWHNPTDVDDAKRFGVSLVAYDRAKIGGIWEGEHQTVFKRPRGAKPIVKLPVELLKAPLPELEQAVNAALT